MVEIGYCGSGRLGTTKKKKSKTPVSKITRVKRAEV
jgi:hypothetical protein